MLGHPLECIYPSLKIVLVNYIYTLRSDFAQTAQSCIGKVMSCPPATENGLIHLLAQN